MFRTTIMGLILSLGAGTALALSQDPVQHLCANFERIDVNGDGAISRAEYRKVQLARWPQIDRNGDGVLTIDDFPRIAADRARTQLGEIAYLDTDGDGRISKSEFVDGDNPLFRQVDQNGNGVVTRSELQAAAR